MLDVVPGDEPGVSLRDLFHCLGAELSRWCWKECRWMGAFGDRCFEKLYAPSVVVGGIAPGGRKFK
jgi:hypothetical protein